jgi:meso-butanediol dehydrogenase / (S,S)-butanediol dehydrogenase / diacetyl reductase
MTATLQKVAVITGAARGIGLAIARRFLGDGWCTALIDVDRAALDHAAAALGDAPRCLALHADVSDEAQVRRAFEAITARWARLDALINNAGVAVFKPLLDTSFDDWSRVMATNLNGPFLCSQAALPQMLENGGGAIVNIASISGLRASTLRVAYGTSKAALMHLTRQQAVELGHLGIRVNAIAPGPVDTAMALQVHTPAIRTGYHAAIPQNRYGTPEEIAAAVAFLCSQEASYVNGQTLAVDGGFDAAGIGVADIR